MSTRSRIGILKDDHIESVYCHFDGYLEHVGMLLVNHYNSLEKAQALISLGDISILGKNTGYRDDNNPDGTQDYYRMRNDPIAPVKDDDMESYLDAISLCEVNYLYLFAGGVWLYSSDGNSWSLVSDRLRELLEKMSGERKRMAMRLEDLELRAERIEDYNDEGEYDTELLAIKTECKTLRTALEEFKNWINQ